MGTCCGADEEAKAAVRTRGLWKRVESVCEAFESVPALALGAAGLVASFVLVGHGCGADGAAGAAPAHAALDPAWIPLVLCGVPILKEALVALVLERRIRAALLITLAMVACVAIGQLFAASSVFPDTELVRAKATYDI